MSLLSVAVKKARYISIPGPVTQFNTYVTLKLQHVKSTTVTVKGPAPCWEQDFLFEVNDVNLGLLVEVWNKGVIWDRALGYHYLPLASVAYAEPEVGGRWIELEATVLMRGGAVVGTAGATGHALLLDCRFEPSFDAEGTGGAELQRKLDLLNGSLGADREQAQRQMQFIAHSGYSEDSDYTSDLNFPLGQHANSSASQFRNAAHLIHTPQRSLEASRENSYEREEYHLHGDTDPLYYNSQPRTRIEAWHLQPSVESASSWRTAADWPSAEDERRPSLERQSSLYDEMAVSYDAYAAATTHIGGRHLQRQSSCEEYQDGGQWRDCGDCEWESVLSKGQGWKLPESSRYSDYNGMTPHVPRPRRTAASLPATPSSTPRRGRRLPVPPARPARRRRLPPVPRPYTHVPYATRPEPPPTEHGCGAPDLADQYSNTHYTSTYDEDGMQPFFDETPHATPPSTIKNASYTSDITPQFHYPDSCDSPLSKRLPSITKRLPQLPNVSRQQHYPDHQTYDYGGYEDQSYQQYGGATEQQYNQTYQDTAYQKLDQYPEPIQQQALPQTYHQDLLPPHLQLQPDRLQQPQQQKPSEAQQLQTTVMTGAATLGNFMSGGAKKLGSFFGAAAAAIAPPIPPAQSTQPAQSVPIAPAAAPLTPFTAATTTIASVPEMLPSLPVTAAVTSPPVSLPRTPTLRRQESMQRPPVRRIRTLPDAPEDLPPSAYDESAYEDEYDYKTEHDQTDRASLDRERHSIDRTSLDRYREDYAIRTEAQDVVSEVCPGLQKVANGVRKPSVDSHHSQAPVLDSHHGQPPVLDRRISQMSLRLEDKLAVPTTQEEPTVDKTKVTFKEEQKNGFHEQDSFEQTDEFRDDQEPYSEEERYREKDERRQEEFSEGQYEENDVFREEPTEERRKPKEDKPKLTARQRWHRAYNKIVMQLNVSLYNFLYDNEIFLC